MHVEADEIRLLPLFAGVEPAMVEWVAARFEARDLDTGVRCTSEAASGYQFFVILEGTATVLHGENTIATLGPGEFFGEGALLTESGRRNATVVASTPMRVGVMFGTDFRQVEQRLPEVAARVRETLSAREGSCELTLAERGSGSGCE